MGLPEVWTNQWAFYKRPEGLSALVMLTAVDGRFLPRGRQILACGTKARVKSTQRTCIILDIGVTGKRPKVSLTGGVAPEPSKDPAAVAPTAGEYELRCRIPRSDLDDYQSLTPDERKLAAELYERLANEKPLNHEAEKRSLRMKETQAHLVSVLGKRKRTPPRRYSPPLPVSPPSKRKRATRASGGKGGKGNKSREKDSKDETPDPEVPSPKKARTSPAAQALRFLRCSIALILFRFIPSMYVALSRDLTNRQAFRLGELSARAKHCADAAAQSSYELSATLAAYLG